MKRILTLLVTVLLTAIVLGQSPQKMSYQAVIRDGGILVASHAVGIRISILAGSSTGTPVYVETHAATTNANGLVTIEIGGGTPVTGTFAGIDWSTGTYYIKTETDPTGGVNYPAIVGTSQLLSVPYALHAKTANSISGAGNVTGEMLYWNSTAWVVVPVGLPGQFLQLTSSRIPFWAGSTYPTLTTTIVTSITGSTATCGGNILNDGGSTIIGKGVCWSTSPDPTIAEHAPESGTGVFTSSITGLKALTTYYVRAYAVNSSGTTYGNEVNFMTTSPAAPTLEISIDVYNPDSPISWTTATCWGWITNDGGATITSNGVCWNTSPNPTNLNNRTTDPTGELQFQSSITGLTAFTTYYLRGYATSSAGIAYSNEISFTTKQLTLPTATTVPTPPIGHTSATISGNVTNDGGAPVTVRGICWNTSTNPTIANSITTEGIGKGIFTSSLTGLAQNTTYYARAYATNSVGTVYGNEINLKTLLGVVNDIEGNTYNTVSIGTQIWMAENLKTSMFNNTDLIGTTTLDITTESTPNYQWAYGSNESNVSVHGRLYTWYAVTDSRSLCPTGWHIPTDAEWTTLTTYLGGESGAGIKLKEAGSTHWNCESWISGCIHFNNGTNETGFTALPGGSRAINRTFSGIGDYGYWWSSTEFSADAAWFRNMYHAAPMDNVGKNNWNKRIGSSVRCIKDN